MRYSGYFFTAILLIAASPTAFCQQAIGTGTDDDGDILTWLIPAAGLATSVFFEEGSEGPLQLTKALLTNELLVEGLKATVSKTRPNGFSDNSFPSGHTARAFMGAAFIHERYGWKYAIPAYLGSAWIGYSRVDEDKHDYVDIVAAAVIGMATGFYFTTPMQRVKIKPLAGQDYFGIQLAVAW